jgi:hypothetical protein
MGGGGGRLNNSADLHSAAPRAALDVLSRSYEDRCTERKPP